MKNRPAVLLYLLVMSIILACAMPGFQAVLTTPQPAEPETATAGSSGITQEDPALLTPEEAISIPQEAYFYTVMSGDRLEDIARIFGVTEEAIRALNGLAEGAEIPAGYELLIPAATVDPATPAAGECDQAAFIKDVTIPDGMKMAPGEKFTKTWRVKNTGSCAWTSDYYIWFLGENQMGGSTTYPITSSTVMPGSEVDISIELTAPQSPGEYRGVWGLYNNQRLAMRLHLIAWIRVEGAAQAEALADTPAAGGSNEQPASTPVAAVSAPQVTPTPVRTNPNLAFSYQPYSQMASAGYGEWAWVKPTYTRLHIINNSRRDLCKVFIYPAESSATGSNYLKEALASYRQTILILPESAYNLQVEACPGASGSAWGDGLFGMTIASQEDQQSGNIDPVWIIDDEDSNLRIYPRKLFTRSGEVRFQVTSTWGEICTIQMWPTFRGKWQEGDPLFYDRENPIGNKQSQLFEITPGIYDMAAWNCQGDFLAKAEDVYTYSDNTWEVELGKMNLGYDEDLLEDRTQCDWICEGYNDSELSASLNTAVDTIGVSLPVNASHADVIPLCFIGRYFTSTQVDVGWKCGWMQTMYGYEFSLQRLYGDRVDALFEEAEPAEIEATVLLLDRRYFEVLEVQPFQVYDDGEQFIRIPRYADAEVLFTVNVYETDKASKFAYKISEVPDGYLVDVEQGNRASYVQGAILVIRPKEKVSDIQREFHKYTFFQEESANVTQSCLSTTTRCECENDRALAVCFLEINTYWPEGDEDFAIGGCEGYNWCPINSIAKGNENSYARIYRTILIIE